MEVPPSSRTASPEVVRFLNRLERELARLDRRLFLAWWNQYTGRSSEGTERWDLARTRLVGRENLRRFVRASLDRPHPPLVARRLELLHRIVEDALVEQHPPIVRLRNRLMRRVIGFRPTWNGRSLTQAEAREILQKDGNRDHRRLAFRALGQLDREMETGLRRLVKARNARARDLGYPSFMQFRLGAEGITLGRLEEFVERILRAARTCFRDFRVEFQERCRVPDYYPWDVTFAYRQRNPLPESLFPGRSMARDVLSGIRGWGFRGGARPFRVVQRSIPIGGMTIGVVPPTDIRVIVNPKGGWDNYMVLFHEFGHAVQDFYTRGPTHLLRGPENIPGFAGFHEGMGGLFEKIATDEAWLRSRPGISPKQVKEFRWVFRHDSMYTAALTAEWVQKEIRLYRNPTGKLSSEFQRLDRKCFGFDDYPVPSFANLFWIEASFYAKSYLLAGLLREQLLRTVLDATRGRLWPNHAVIPWLAQNWFRHGDRFDWVPRVREVTGRPFGLREFLEAAHDSAA